MNSVKTLFLVLVILVLVSGCKSGEEKKTVHLEKAKAYIEKGEYNSAEIELRNVIQIDPASADAYMLLGDTFLKLSKARDAYNAYLNVEKLDPKNTDAGLKLASFLLLAKQTDNALEKLDGVLTREPENNEALFLKAAVMEQKEQLDSAADIYTRLMELDPRHVNARIGLARIRIRQGNTPEAETILKQSVTIDSKNTAPRLALASLYVSTKRIDDAEATLLAAIAENPDASDPYTVLGNFYFQFQKQDKAESAYQKALSLDDQNTRPYLVLAGFYEKVGKNNDARLMYEKAQALAPDNFDVKNAFARFYLETRNLDACEKLIEKILTQRPGFASTRLLKGELLLLKEAPDDAITIFDDLIKEEPNSTQIKYFRGLANFMRGDTRIAKIDLTEAVDANPGLLNARQLLSEIHYKDKNFDLARKECEEILRSRPDQYQVVLMLGNISYQQGDAAEAQKQYTRLTELDPKNPMGYYQTGLLYRAMKKYDLSLENFEKALAINPILLDAFSQIVAVQMLKEDSDGALATCGRQMAALKEFPFAQAVVKYLEGQIYREKERIDDAETAYKESQALNENYLPAYYGLANLFAASGREDQAISQFKSVLEKNPDIASAHMYLGVIFELKKQKDMSETHYRKALEINPDFTAAANNLAYLLADQEKDLNKALELARAAKGSAPNDASIMDTLGWVYYKKGLYDNAISEFSDSLEKQPDQPVINYHMGLAQYGKGEQQKAKSALEKALALNTEFDGADNAKRILAEIEAER